MKKFRLLLVGMLVVFAVIVPLAIALAANTGSHSAVVRVATEPTPTPTRIPGQPCHGGGC